MLSGTKAGYLAIGSGETGYAQRAFKLKLSVALLCLLTPNLNDDPIVYDDPIALCFRELAMIGTKLPVEKKEEEGGPLAGMLGSSGGSSSMLRNPLVLGGVMVLIFWQSGRLFGNKGSPGNGSRRPGGRQFDDDMDMLRGAMSGAGSRGPGGGMGSAEFEEAFADFKRGKQMGGAAPSRFEELDQK